MNSFGRVLIHSIVATLIIMFVVGPALAQTLPFKLGKPVESLDNLESARYTGPGENFLQDYMRQSAERAFADENLAMFSQRFYGIESYQVSSLDLALEGMGAGATLGLFTGAVANTFGLWNEDTSWYVMGAAAALGAFLGVSGKNDPEKRTRYRWSIDANSGSQNR